MIREHVVDKSKALKLVDLPRGEPSLRIIKKRRALQQLIVEDLRRQRPNHTLTVEQIMEINHCS